MARWAGIRGRQAAANETGRVRHARGEGEQPVDDIATFDRAHFAGWSGDGRRAEFSIIAEHAALHFLREMRCKKERMGCPQRIAPTSRRMATRDFRDGANECGGLHLVPAEHRRGQDAVQPAFQRFWCTSGE